jgi:hypothetical protein
VTHRLSTPDAMNIVRIAISLFILILLGTATAGWIWTAGHQSPPQARASHLVLGLASFAGIAGLVALWRPRSPRG